MDFNKSFTKSSSMPTGARGTPGKLDTLTSQSLHNTLPKLPSYNFNDLKSTPNHHKKQTLTYTNQVPQTFMNKVIAPELTCKAYHTDSVAIQQSQPSWLSLDKKVLKFFAFYREGVHELRQESERIRKVNIYFFLEDDTVQVTEPREENSGIVQGNYIRRHRVPKHTGGEDFFSIDDFDCGREVTIYGKVFRIVDCDSFTRSFYLSLGRPMMPKEEYPDTEARAAAAEAKAKRKDPNHMDWKRYAEFAAGGKICLFSKEERESHERFLYNDRQVLRFFGVWDDRQQAHGDLRYFIVLFFLSDKTVKVMEVNQTNSGRDPFPIFVKRQKLPRKTTGNSGVHSIGIAPTDYITDDDLMIGRTVNLFGRDILLYDCDAFTKTHFEGKGIKNFEPIDVSIPEDAPRPIEIPPHNGFGSEEDSLSSWKSMVLKPPKKDVAKLLELDSKCLRYGGFLEDDPARRVLVAFHLADNSVGIFEQPSRNTGYVGGKFLQRQRIKKGAQQLKHEGKPLDTDEYFSKLDFSVGVKVCLNGHWIMLDQTDGQTLSLINGAQKESSLESSNLVLKKIIDALMTRYVYATTAFRVIDKEKDGIITVDELGQTCKDLNIDVSRQELLTVIKFMDKNNDGVVDFNEFVAVVTPKEGVEREVIKRTADGKDLTFNRAAKRQMNDAFTERSLQFLRAKLESSRSTALDAFRMLSDMSPDSRLGEAEFRKCLNVTLQMNLPDDMMEALCRKLFPTAVTRMAMFEFQKLMEAPHYYKKV